MLGQFLVDPLSLRYLQPLQNSNFKFKQCLKPTDEAVSYTHLDVYKRQEHPDNQTCLK